MITTKYHAFSAILLWPLTLTAGGKESPSEGGIYGIIYKDGLVTVSVHKRDILQQLF